MKPAKQVAYLRHLTTKLGLVQHAKESKPDLRFGFTLDDNARAIIASILLSDTFGYKLRTLISPYINFIERAQRPDGWFVNFFDRRGRPLEKRGSQDSFGRAVWALSLLSVNQHDKRLAHKARMLLNRSLHHVRELTATRALANALLGACGRRDLSEARDLAGNIAKRFTAGRQGAWIWFENTLTYENGLLPYALAEAARLLDDKKILALSQEIFEFLDNASRLKGTPSPIGNKGWYTRGKKRASYDQQPIDAAAMILVACSLYRATGDSHYRAKALDWWSWFHGNNSQGVTLINPRTGGVYDGINRDGLNRNQGAENIVVYLMMDCAMHQIIES